MRSRGHSGLCPADKPCTPTPPSPPRSPPHTTHTAGHHCIAQPCTPRTPTGPPTAHCLRHSPGTHRYQPEPPPAATHTRCTRCRSTPSQGHTRRTQSEPSWLGSPRDRPHMHPCPAEAPPAHLGTGHTPATETRSGTAQVHTVRTLLTPLARCRHRTACTADCRAAPTQRPQGTAGTWCHWRRTSPPHTARLAVATPPRAGHHTHTTSHVARIHRLKLTRTRTSHSLPHEHTHT